MWKGGEGRGRKGAGWVWHGIALNGAESEKMYRRGKQATEKALKGRLDQRTGYR